jgi:hypothetical protein
MQSEAVCQKTRKETWRMVLNGPLEQDIDHLNEHPDYSNGQSNIIISKIASGRLTFGCAGPALSSPGKAPRPTWHARQKEKVSRQTGVCSHGLTSCRTIRLVAILWVACSRPFGLCERCLKARGVLTTYSQPKPGTGERLAAKNVSITPIAAPDRFGMLCKVPAFTAALALETEVCGDV